GKGQPERRVEGGVQDDVRNLVRQPAIDFEVVADLDRPGAPVAVQPEPAGEVDAAAVEGHDAGVVADDGGAGGVEVLRLLEVLQGGGPGRVGGVGHEADAA